MATIHPSRLGLVPQARPKPPPPPPSREDELRRKLLERRQAKESSNGVEDKNDRRRDETGVNTRESSAGRDGDDNRDRSGRSGEDRDRDRDRRRDHEDDRRRDRDEDLRERRDRSEGRQESRRDEDQRVRSHRSREREERDRPPHEGDRSRRASPSYRAYDGPPPSQDETNGNGNGRPPWLDARSGMPPFPPRGAMPPFPPRGGGGGGWNGPMDLERRRVERENMTLTVWPASPERPYKDEDERDAERAARRKAKKSKSKKSKRKSKYSDSDSSSTDSEEERRRRRRRKEKDRARNSRYPSDESEDERQRKKRKSRDRSERQKSERSERSAIPEVKHDLAEQWVEKDGEVVLVPSPKDTTRLHLPIETQIANDDEDEDDDEVGPHLPVEHSGRDRHRDKYHNMLYGEAEAMARFAAAGQRIPRRGEIGLDSNQIEAFENSGYVMSGSRHQRMNAVRLRKENQVINAEEKRAILKLQREEQEKKEGAIVSQFRELLEERLKSSGADK